jgi:hypothetical protein
VYVRIWNFVTFLFLNRPFGVKKVVLRAIMAIFCYQYFMILACYLGPTPIEIVGLPCCLRVPLHGIVICLSFDEGIHPFRG